MLDATADVDGPVYVRILRGDVPRLFAASEPEQAGPLALARARALCVEQTVEFPAELLPPGEIPEQIVGRIESLTRVDAQRFELVVSYAVETAGGELTQLLNVLFGNVSLQPGVRLVRIELTESFAQGLGGPRFGRSGLRSLLRAPERPLLCSALKPMGLAAEQLASMAHDLALGGIDLIKDDHGLVDQPFCVFEERVGRCAEAVARANEQAGGSCLYAPNVTAAGDLALRRGRRARELGAGALLFAPGLAGMGSMRQLADDPELGLPIISHPAWQGSFVVHPDHGISHHALFGQLHRLAGADATIFPSFGGRFSFSQGDCRSLVEGTACALGRLRRSLPVPAGGMRLERVPELIDFYGRDVALLIGGDLHRDGYPSHGGDPNRGGDLPGGGPDLVASCHRSRRPAEAA